MAKYPQSVFVNEKHLADLTKTYEQAYVQIYSEIAGSTNFGVARRKQILARIEVILKELGVNTTEFIAQNIPKYYTTGADEAVAQLKSIYAPVSIKTGFNTIHREAIAALVSDAASAFGESIGGVKRNVKQLMSIATKETMTQQLATGQISGEALRKIKDQIVGTIQSQGLHALVDKDGRPWTLDRYSEMLIRTKAVEARNMGLKNRMVENNYDLVQVSAHGSTDVCGDWEGKILSLTGATTEVEGEEIATVADAEDEGLFHPNCKHAINALTLELARDTMEWNSNYVDPDTGRRGRYEQGLLEYS